MKTNQQKKLTRAQQKIIDKLVKSQEVVKRYLMFNGVDTQAHWIPPLDYAEEHTNSAAQARVLRLAKCLLSNEIFYIAKKGKEPDLYKRYTTEFDRYIISHTSIGLVRSEDGKYTQNETFPLVVPMVFTQKKYEMADIKYDRPWPIIMLSNENGTVTHRIQVDKDIQYRMLVVLQYIGSFKVPFTDECIEYILFDGHKNFLNYMIDRIEELAEKTPHGAISRDTVESSLNIAVFKQLVNYKLPYINSYVNNPPIRDTDQEK